MIFAALTGALLGAWHVVSGPDHLAAVTPMATASRERHAAKIGLAWGIGHASGVWLVGVLLLAFGSLIPLDALGLWSERVVGLAIVAVGVWGLVRVRRGEFAEGHDHHHLSHPRSLASLPSALGIGLIHGLAGSSHLYGVLPALALASSERLAYLGGFGLASILAMSGFAWLLAMIVGRLPHSRERVRRGALIGASTLAIVVGLVWLVLAA